MQDGIPHLGPDQLAAQQANKERQKGADTSRFDRIEYAAINPADSDQDNADDPGGATEGG